MSTYALLADLPLKIDSYELEPRELCVSSEFTRMTTTIRLRGSGQDGLGEDATYDALDHIALQEAGPMLPLAGSHTIEGFSRLLGELDLFPTKPEREMSRNFRRWAFESAALDLALRQAGTSLAEALGKTLRPVTFVVSLRLGDPPSTEPIKKRLELYPGLRFKLDPTSGWDDALIAELAATNAVDVLDLKGLYKGTPVDQPADSELYRRVVEAFPEAWIEDPALTPETRAALEGYERRITWDAPIHSAQDITELPFKPRMLNIKPSRFGSIEELLDAYDHCDANGIGTYGGGQFELGPGRGQIQYLASLYNPDSPNDVSPGGFHTADPVPGLPRSPLEPVAAKTGFRWT